MKKSNAGVLLACITIVSLTWLQPLHATPVFINEIHYDNAGGDTNEAVEIFGTAGVDLSGWLLQLYNGSSGSVYRSLDLGGILPDLESGFGALAFPVAGIQNGAPDGIALVNAGNMLVQFLSYEGVFEASDGFATGSTSDLIGIAESGATLASESLQLVGSGSAYEDFQWQAGTSSFGAINPEQHVPVLMASVPVPASWLLCLPGLALLWVRRKRMLV